MVDLSICIPAYKNPFLLERCLTSILNQTFDNYEIIITDDSLTDELKYVINQFNDKRINYYKNERSFGSPANWNRAVSFAKGKYIQVLHHDDWFATSNALEIIMIEFERNPSVDFIFTGCCDIGQNSCVKRIVKNKDLLLIQKNPTILYAGNLIGAPSVTFFRNGLNIFYDENLIWLVDLDFYIQILSRNSNFLFIPHVLVNIGINDSQITNKCLMNKLLIIKEYSYLYKKLNIHRYTSNHNVWLNILAKYKVFTNKQLEKLEIYQIKLNIIDSLFVVYFCCKQSLVFCLKNIIRFLKNGNHCFIRWTW